MKLSASPIRNEKGVALPLALFALVMLTGLLLAFLSMAGMEPTIAANLNDVTRARYVADAGVEFAFDQLAAAPLTGTGSWSDILTKGGTIASNMTFPGLPAALGTFSVTMRNDIQAADAQITGVPPEPAANATNDTNGVIIVTASGTYRGVTRQIQVVVKRMTLPPLPGALNFPGVQTDINPGGTAHLHVNGVDYNRDGSLGTGPLKFGYTVPSGVNPSTGTTYEQYVENSLTRHDMNEMTGRDQTKPCCVAIQRGSDLSCPCEGERTIVPQSVLPANEQLTQQKVADFINRIKQSATVVDSSAANPIVINNGTVTAAGPGNQGFQGSKPLGTVAKPTITYIKGTPDPDDRFATVKIQGNTSGAGLLIIEDGDLEISGTFRWDGVILVTGKNVGVVYKKFSRSFIYGAMVVNETDSTERAGSYEMLIESNTHGDSSNINDQFTTFYSSQQNLDLVRGIRAFVRLSSWREI